ncbi:MAG: NAD-dependent epimerase/dehydratase family protein [Elusimicrobia bacterium]|nr:NAD-dependent epimerase/dehydratase family protein [Elusimicrobiota bacterium]
MSRRLVVAVTGAGGELGRGMVDLLRTLEVERRCVDLVRPAAPTQEPWMICDLADPGAADALRDFLAPATHVIHLASRDPRASDLAEAFPAQFHVDVLGTLNVLRALPAGVRHVAYASSTTVYGLPEHLPVSEDQPARPRCVCGLGKLAAEQHVAAFARERSLPAAALRIASAYGPGGNRGRAVPSMIERALSGRSIRVYGDGSSRRDYVHVSDVCHAVIAASLHGLTGPVNVGSGKGTSAVELAELIMRLAGSSAPVEFVPRPAGGPAGASLVCDIRRLAGATQFSPRVTLEQGLAGMIGPLKRSAVAR